MLAWMFFCFLWDDPRFARDPNLLLECISNPHSPEETDLVEKHRQLRLKALDGLYLRIMLLEQKIVSWKEESARGAWMWKRVIDHVPDGIAEQAVIDGEVCKQIDQEFTFLKAIGMD